MLYGHWDKPDKGIALFAWGIALSGLGLFLFFTQATYESMNRQREIARSYRTVLTGGQVTEPQKLNWMMQYDGGILALAVLVAFSGGDCWWAHSRPGPSGHAVEFKIPVNVQVDGQNPPVPIEIPLKLTTP